MSSRAVSWLEQFDPDDRAAAAALLDAVRFLPGGDVIAGLRRTIESFISMNPDRAPAALAPVISHEDMVLPEGLHAAGVTIFRDFDPAQPIANEPGSEALIAHLIREMRKGSGAGSIVSGPITLDGLNTAETRTLIFVTDYIGSGAQVVNYVEAWHRHPTIRSWRSFGWLQIVVVAYAATAAGKQAVDRNPHVDRLEIVEVVPGLEQLRTADTSGKIEELCRVYARRGKVWPALGYRKSGGLFASSFSVPNNLPAILIRRSSRWEPFFDERSVPSDLADAIGDHRPDIDIAQRLQDAGQHRLAARHRDGHIDRRWQVHIAILAILPGSVADLSLAVGADVPTVVGVLDSLERLGLIDGVGKITPAGRTALNVHRRKPRRGSALLVPDPTPYYPRYTR